MKLNSSVSKFITNKWVLNVVTILAFLNILFFVIIGNLNDALYFIILAILVRYFSKNMVLVLGIPLLLVNLYAMQKRSYIFEGMETNSDKDKIKTKIEDKKKTVTTTSTKNKIDNSGLMPGTDAEPTSVQDEAYANINDNSNHFKNVKKKKGSTIDYATTVEDAYDNLNNILGSEGIQNLTKDTESLMEQQKKLFKSMESFAPLMEKLVPMADNAKKMMSGLDNTGIQKLMGMAQSMTNKM